MHTRKPGLAKKVVSIFIVLVLLAGSVLVFLNRFQIHNWWQARNFSASPAMSEVITELSLTKQGDTLLKSTHPQITDAATFNNGCAAVDHAESGHVVGCYTSAHNIFIFNVSDERLDGIIEVTTAHELLHAAWAQMPQSEKREITTGLKNYYKQYSTLNPELAERMKVYEHLSDSAFANELHSVFGTEVHKLPAWLEQHYAKWFTDRQALVNFFDSYHGVFAALQNEANEIEAKMHELRAQVESASQLYEQNVEAFNRDVQEFNLRNDNYEFSNNRAEFDRLVAVFTERRSALQADRAAIEAGVAEYEQLRTRLKEISSTSEELNRSLDSNLPDLGN